MMRRKRIYATAGFTALSALMLMHPIQAWADCYCNLSEPVDVIVKNWQTFKPKVTAMHSLNAYLANQLGEKVYYVPTLESLPNVKNRMYNCTDFRGTNQKFAAIYDGFFNVECYDALIRKPDGTYSKVPSIMKDVEKGSERELTLLGYDFLLRREAINDLVSNDTMISAKYITEALDLTNGSVDVRTAVMDIYKAIGQEIHDVTYVFANDPTLTLETSPIQQEIHLQMAQDGSIDSSAGAGYVFVTRTNPDLYWDKAINDNVIMADKTSSANDHKTNDKFSTTTSKALTLAEFCSYAYEIMNIYGEPTMTTSEKSILLQLYGTDIPYQTVDSFAVEAIENFIAKGIISPDDDRQNLNWNAPITPKYMLTLLMRISDVDSRMTYKDVQITINPTLLDKKYYSADIAVESAAIIDLEEDNFYSQIATYVDNEFKRETVTNNLGAHDASDFYIQNHLVVMGADGDYYPLSVLVTSMVDENGNAHLVTGGNDKEGTVPFAECMGWSGDSLRINVYIKQVKELLQSDGTYHFYLQTEDGGYSSTPLRVTPGRKSQEYGDRGTSSSRDEDEDEDNLDRIRSLPGVNLASTQSAVVIITIKAGSENSIYFKPNSQSAGKRSLGEIMQDTDEDGYGYLVPGDKSDIHIKKLGNNRYQVEGVRGSKDLQGRTETTSNDSLATKMEGFVQKDEELIVGVDWLKEAGFIVSHNMVGDNVLCLKSKYNEIYLDKAKKLIVAGTTIYTLLDLDEDEIFYDGGDAGYFVNFRAVMGWTGDYLLFKNSESGTVTVSIKDYPIDGKNSVTGDSGMQNVLFKQFDRGSSPDATAEIVSYFNELSLSMYIQGSIDSSRTQNQGNAGGVYGGQKYNVSMTSTYPFANWFIFSKGALEEKDGTDQDWLFVLKPKKVRVAGQDVIYDDKESRQVLKNVMGELKISDSDISVWAYPLSRSAPESIPEGFDWDDSYGWTYTPTKVTNVNDFLKDYMDPGATFNGGSSGSAKNVLPMIEIGGELVCVNFNSYAVNSNMGEQLLDYGDIPASAARPSPEKLGNTSYLMGMFKAVGQTSIAQNILNNLAGTIAEDVLNNAAEEYRKKFYCHMNPSTGKLELTGIQDGEPTMESCIVYPTVTNPAMWVMAVKEYTFDEILKEGNVSRIYRGTDALEVIKKGSDIYVYQGNTLLDLEDLKSKKYMSIRRTDAGNTVRYMYSESQLNAFTLNKGESSVSENKTMQELGVGRASSHIDVIDWDEFTLTRLLEDFEFGVAMAMVLVLYIIPRMCLFVFLMLLSLGVIQNVKIVQLFCDKIFDPYKFLTMGRRDVHTFRPGVAFRNSIIAMAIFALFMDGTIIHIFEWFIQLMAFIFAGN